MTGGEIMVVVLLGMLGGALLVGAVWFFYILLTSVRRLTETIEKLLGAVDTRSLQKVGVTLTAIAGQGDKMVAGMAALTKAANLFNKTVFNRAVNQTNPAEETAAPEEESGFIEVSEEQAADNEVMAELAKAGFPVDDRNAPAPDPDRVIRVNC